MNTLKPIDLLQHITQQLIPALKDTSLCQSYAWLLLEKLYSKTKTELIVSDVLPLTTQQNNHLKEWICLLTEQKMPIQYILGSVPFNDLDILVSPPTLIPRPETEEWTSNLVAQLKKLHNQKLSILDIATGSGCIALTFAHHVPQSHITATDISPTALQLANKNSVHNNIYNVTFLYSDLFVNIPVEKKFDIIVTNPPYIAQSEEKNLDESVIKWEDSGALFAQDNGLAIIKKIIDCAPLYIKNNTDMLTLNIPQIAIEIGYQQGQDVKNYMIAAGYNNVHVYKDLEKRDRVVVGRVNHVATTNATE